ncbi:MAG TPA: large-conductance mechanosensitive channel protein MscL [Candidatus Dependentiae bacterium]|nr:large-conductance mechanosensitive channel protein MscL [Candidatus Dependentiae bacterium]
MKEIKEFKEFAIRENVINLAIGFVIGSAVSKIVTSLVNDIIMPPLGFLLGGVDFGTLQIILKEASDNKPAVTIKYGLFINTIVDFLLVALALFFLIKIINRLWKKQESKIGYPQPTEKDVLIEIRNILSNNLDKKC